MKKIELLEMVSSLANEDSVDEILLNSNLSKGFENNVTLDLDKIKKFLNEDQEGFAYLQSYTDSKISKAINTFKENNLEKLINEEILKRNPQKTPLQIEMEEMKREMKSLRDEKNKVERLAKYKDVLVNKKIPIEFSSFLLGDNDDTTNNNINLFEEGLKGWKNSLVEEWRGQNSFTPPDSNEAINTLNKDDFLKMDFTEQQKVAEENPQLFNTLIND